MSAVSRRTLAPLAVVTAAAFVFALLLVLVRLQWAPLESADHGAAARLNSLVAGHPGASFTGIADEMWIIRVPGIRTAAGWAAIAGAILLVPAPASTVSGVRVDDEGIRAHSEPEVVLDVLFDERRIWSFWLHRDGESAGGTSVVPWPLNPTW